MRNLALIAAITMLVACGGGTPPPSTSPVIQPRTIASPEASPGDAGTPAVTGADTAPAPATPTVTLLATQLGGPRVVAIDASWAYWLDDAHGLARTPKRGGGTVTTVYSGASRSRAAPPEVAIDTTDVYWTFDTSDGTEPGIQSLSRQDKNGGKPIVLAWARGSPIGCLAVDDATVYWAEGSSIMRAAKKGGGPMRIASGQNLGPPWSTDCIAVDGTRVYWSVDDLQGAIRAAPKTGGAITLVVKGIHHAQGVHVDDKSVYWVSGDKIMAAPKGGGTFVQLAQASGRIGAIALDDKYVYFTTSGEANGSVTRVAKDGSTRTILASGQAEPSRIAVDGESVFWACYGTSASSFQDGNISKIDKP
jgi:hypothetical protein